MPSTAPDTWNSSAWATTPSANIPADIVVITAGLAPTGNTPNVAVNDRTFLQQMYQAGLAGFGDVVIGIHPYSWGNPPDFVCCDNVDGQGWDDRPQFFFMNNIRDYSEIIRANGHNVQMWATEFGWATWEGYPTEAPDPWMAYNSIARSMDYAMRAFQIGQSRRGYRRYDPVESQLRARANSRANAVNLQLTAFSFRRSTAAKPGARDRSIRLWPAAPKGRTGVSSKHRLIAGLMILLVAACLRIWQFERLPPGLQHDEVFKAQEAVQADRPRRFSHLLPDESGTRRRIRLAAGLVLPDGRHQRAHDQVPGLRLRSC